MEDMESSHPARRARWVSRLVEVIQPVSLRADRLGSMRIFAGLRRRDLEFMAGVFRETFIDRGTRLTVQGEHPSRLFLIQEGEALISADAHPLRVAARGDLIGLPGMLYAIDSPESAIALSPIRTFEADATHSSRRLPSPRPGFPRAG